MAVGKRISDLSTVSTLPASSLIEVEQSGVSKSFDASDFARLSIAPTFAGAVTSAVNFTANDGTNVVTLNRNFVGTTSNHTFSLYSNNTARVDISNTGNFDFKSGTVTTSNASASEVGYKGYPQLVKSAGYTLTLADAGQFIWMNNGGTVTIPANATVAFPVGTYFYVAAFTASCSVGITTDTMYLTGTGRVTVGTRTVADGGMFKAIKVSSTQWAAINLGGVT